MQDARQIGWADLGHFATSLADIRAVPAEPPQGLGGRLAAFLALEFDDGQIDLTELVHVSDFLSGGDAQDTALGARRPSISRLRLYSRGASHFPINSDWAQLQLDKSIVPLEVHVPGINASRRGRVQALPERGSPLERRVVVSSVRSVIAARRSHVQSRGGDGRPNPHAGGSPIRRCVRARQPPSDRARLRRRSSSRTQVRHKSGTGSRPRRRLAFP